VPREIFPTASDEAVEKMLALGIELELLSEVGGEMALTPEGLLFSNCQHWRLWAPSAQIMKKLDHLGLSSCILTGQSNAPIIIDLFAGAGGLGLGFETAGFRTKVAVDNDTEACIAHSLNFPQCKVVKDDINVIAKSPIKHLCEKFEIPSGTVSGVIGGPPCQGFSYIGERVTHDERNLLTSKFMDVVVGIKPDFFVMENVAGLINSGILPKVSDYVKRLHKNIGVPATEIVDSLPTLPKSIAKRDRQFRKRFVSDIISSFREGHVVNLTNIVTCIDHTYTSLLCHFKKNVLRVYNNDEDLVTVLATKNILPIATISMAIVLDKLNEKKNYSEHSYICLLRDLSKEVFETSVIPTILQNIVTVYETAPKPVNHKGTRVGPVLWHLIERASEFYDVCAPKLLNAASFGAPQARERMFLIGIRKDLGKTFEFPASTHSLPLGKGKRAYYDPTLPIAPTTYDAIGDLPDVDMFEGLIDGDTLPYSALSPSHNVYSKLKRLEALDSGDKSLPSPNWNPFEIDCCKRTLHADHAIARIRETAEGRMDDKSKRTRLSKNSVSHTLRAGTREGKGSHTAVRPLHYEYNRVITVREGARLMGFPDWMTFHKTKWHGFRLVGNGVPSYLGKAIATKIYETLYSDNVCIPFDEPSIVNCRSNG
jgi:site-specific DNA-cytosine methylase